MSLLTSRPRLKRYIGAVIATFVTTWIAAHNLARGEEVEQACSRDDVAIWHLALLEPEAAPSPQTTLETTLAFLEACPDRPEAEQALAIAGMASVELDDAEGALSYFERVGELSTLRQGFYYAAALLAVGRTDEAWEERDRLVSIWLETLASEGTSDISIRTTDTGRLVRLMFAEGERLDGVQATWIALPNQAGWPASIRISRQGVGRFKPIMFEPIAQDETLFVELYRCRSRRLLARVLADPDSAETDANAYAALTAYLNAPDGVTNAPTDSGIYTCVWPDRLLLPAEG